MKNKYSLAKLLEIFDKLNDEAKEDVLNHARQLVKKQKAELQVIQLQAVTEK